MTRVTYFTADVFTRTRFGGNPLAVVMDADGLDGATMQALASEFNLSETTFVLAPADPGNTARVRIFGRTAETPFAGHPMVGTAFVLANRRPDLTTATFEIPAGIVRIDIDRDADGSPLGARIEVPQPLSVTGTVDPAVVASALRLNRDGVVTAHHPPTIASNGNPYVIAEVTREALAGCDPDLAAFRNARDAHPDLAGRFSVLVYSRDGQMVRARMFAPLSGIWEDPATGSANAPLACLLLSLAPDLTEASFEVHQGIEMGRPSLLHVDARRTPDGIVATLRGSCVAVMSGVIDL